MPRKTKKGGNNEYNIYDEIQKRSEIKGTDGSQYVKFNLHANESIITLPGSLITMNSGIEKAELNFDGITSGLKKLLAGESFLYQKFTGNGNNGILLLGSNFINSVIAMKIYTGNDFRLSRYSFLACTDNIKIDMTTQSRGIIGFGQEEGFFLPTAKCVSGNYGYIWLSTFGSFEKIDVPANEHLIVDNGMFLACNNNYNYTITKLGKSLFSSWLGGEGFGMKFQGPSTIFIQTKNINEFLMQLGYGGGNSSSSDNIAVDAGKGAVKGILEGIFGT